MNEHALLQWILSYKYAGLYAALALGIVGVPVPDEVLLTFTGYNVWSGHMNYFSTATIAFLGSLTGMSLSYLIGRFVGQPLLERWGPKIGIHTERLARAETFFQKYGAVTLVFGYFVPGLRHLTSYFSGMSRLSLRTYYVYASIGAIVWTSTFILLGLILGPEWKSLAHWLRHYLFLVGAPTVALIIIGWVYWRWLHNKRADTTK